MSFRSQVTRYLLALVAVLAFATAQPVLIHASNWKKLSTATTPPARSYCAMAYDPVSKKVVLFGGLGKTGNLNDTWAFDGTNWTQLRTAVAPKVRNGATMAFDRSTKQLVMFGGFDKNKYLQDTWVWNGVASTWTQVQMPSPPPRATGAMLFTDPLSGRAMMFGGFNATQTICLQRHLALYGNRLGETASQNHSHPEGLGNCDPRPIETQRCYDGRQR